MTLVNFFHETIFLAYLILLSHNPKAVPKKICKKCFDILWKGKRYKFGYYLACWKLVARPKHERGCVLRQIPIFSNALVAKRLWNLISKEGMWKWVLV